MTSCNVEAKSEIRHLISHRISRRGRRAYTCNYDHAASPYIIYVQAFNLQIDTNLSCYFTDLQHVDDLHIWYWVRMN